MNSKQKNTLAAMGIALGLASLPSTWFTIRDSKLQGVGDLFGSAFPGMTVSATGLNGSVTALVKAPLWFIAGVAIGANVLQLMRSSNAFVIPKFAQWFVAVLAAIWITLPMAFGLASGKVTLGLGWFLALACVAASLACLVAPDTTTEMPRLETTDVYKRTV